MLKMPELKPIRIPTKELSGWKAIWTWIMSRRKWELTDKWQFVLPDKTTIIIEKGFKFDGASIPRLFWSILSPVGLLFIPALIHDYAYVHNKLISINPNNGELIPYNENAGRRYWDELFRDVAIQVNGFRLINYTAWIALFLFGCWAWNKYRKNMNSRAEPEKK